MRHGLDYLVVCSLCKSAAAVKINLFVYLFIGLFPCLLSVTTLSLIRVLHVQELSRHLVVTV